MKKVILIHGWGGSPEKDWFTWLKKELELKNFKVYNPLMPNTFHPKIDEWVSTLNQVIGETDADTYFVGHSIGCQAILRYIQTLKPGKKVGGCIFVAGWFNLTETTWDETYTKDIAKPWIQIPIDFNKIKSHTNKFIAIQSDNDPYVDLSNGDIFKSKLGAKVIIEHNKGHISGEDGVNELSSVLKSILEITK